MIIINNDYRIDSDDNCYTLQERRIAKTGKNAGQDIWSPVSYHKTLKNTLEKYRRVAHKNALRDGGDVLIDNWIQRLGEQDEAFISALNGLLEVQG